MSFYINKLSVTGDGVKAATIDFQPGTNIIYGSSELGKSYIVECLDYVFGADNMKLKASSGYDMVTLIVKLDSGHEVRIERRFDVGGNDVSIFTTDPRYEGLSCTNVSKVQLDAFWLRLMEIEEGQTIVSSGYYEHKQLKLAHFKPMFLIKEARISREKSIIPSSMESLSALLFLLSGKDYHNVPTVESTKEKKKRGKGAKDEILDQMGRIRDRRLDLLQLLSDNDETKMKEMIERFHFVEGRLQDALSESQKLHSQIEKAQKKLTSYKVQRENYALLQSLYDSQLKRMAFATEGQMISFGHGSECKCPFCGNTTTSEASPDTISASIAEFSDTQEAIQKFKKASAELEATIIKQENRLTALQGKCADVDRRISESYAPRVEEMRVMISDFAEYERYSGEYEALGKEYERLDNRLTEIDKELDEPDNKFKPKDEIDSQFFEDMKGQIENMITSCGYPHFERVRLEKATMDISIDQQDKKTFGEGYCAFFNATLAFCLFKHLCEKGLHSSGLLIMDSPIQAMKDQDGIELTKGLFEYITRNSGCGQVIIIDNRLPEGANLEEAKIQEMTSPFLPDFKHHRSRRKDVLAGGEQLTVDSLLGQE